MTLDSNLYAFDLCVQGERYIPLEIERGIEECYYARTDALARRDLAFAFNLDMHAALTTDHGVMHARDVACRVLQVLDIAEGLLIPARSPARREFMRSYAVMLAYLHDIGMCDPTPFGRQMHAEFATQEVFTDPFQEWIDILWKQNMGPLIMQLTKPARQGSLRQDPRLVFMEMLAMANTHSKTKVPVTVLNNALALRRQMQLALGMDLRDLHRLQSVERTCIKKFPLPVGKEEREPITPPYPGNDAPDFSTHPNRKAQARYRDFRNEAFAWLTAEDAGARALASDVIDTLRALRCADALRRRGAMLRTSGGCRIVLNPRTASAVYLPAETEGEPFMVEANNIISGETNIACSELTREGDLHIAFLQGAFPDQRITRRAAHRAALVIQDIQADVIASFQRPREEFASAERPRKSQCDMRILLEGVEDNPQFVQIVSRELQSLNPVAARRVHCLPSRYRDSYRRASSTKTKKARFRTCQE